MTTRNKNDIVKLDDNIDDTFLNACKDFAGGAYTQKDILVAFQSHPEFLKALFNQLSVAKGKKNKYDAEEEMVRDAGWVGLITGLFLMAFGDVIPSFVIAGSLSAAVSIVGAPLGVRYLRREANKLRSLEYQQEVKNLRKLIGQNMEYFQTHGCLPPPGKATKALPQRRLEMN